MKTVLIVEDLKRYQDDWAKVLQLLGLTIFQAFSLEDGYRLYDSVSSIDLIVMDACVNNEDRPDSMDLIRHIRQTFTGPMVAASGLPEYRVELMKIGCDHQSPKREVPETVRKILGL